MLNDLICNCVDLLPRSGRTQVNRYLYLADVVYETKPMKSANDQAPLDMACVDNEAAVSGISAEQAWQGYRNMQDGRTIPFDEAFRRARSG